MNQKSQALMTMIEKKRHEMIQLASTTAYCDDRVVQASKNLDQLIIEFYTLKKR